MDKFTKTLKTKYKKLLDGIVGAVAAAAFIRSAQQNNALTGKDLLLKFDKTMKTVAKYELHEFAILNELVFRYLEHASMCATRKYRRRTLPKGR